MERTGIVMPRCPPDYKGAVKWYDSEAKHPAHTHRIQWPCHKCGKVFWGHCGLGIMSGHRTDQPPNL